LRFPIFHPSCSPWATDRRGPCGRSPTCSLIPST
jgi:hypothetical protein